MLESAKSGATKTRLMYEAFLSHNQMVEYLDFLLTKKLIAPTPDGKHYVPTEKGHRFLKMYGEIKDSVNIDRSGVLTVGKDPDSVGNDAIDELTGSAETGGEATRSG